MKPSTDAHFEEAMRFFTRQRYLDFNSPDDEVADAADEDWEVAQREYEQHLAGLRDRMPGNVYRLTALNLHDAEVLSRVQEVQPGAPALFSEFPLPLSVVTWSALGIVTVGMDNEIISLIYCLWDNVRELPAPPEWKFSKLEEHWLYDEVDVIHDRPGPFVHRILFSTGVELEIPFVTVVIHRFQAHVEVKGDRKTQGP